MFEYLWLGQKKKPNWDQTFFSDSLLEQLEELMGALEKTRQELDTTKLHLSSTQQSLHDRDRHLNSLRQDRRKQLQEILEMKLVATFRVE